MKWGTQWSMFCSMANAEYTEDLTAIVWGGWFSALGLVVFDHQRVPLSSSAIGLLAWYSICRNASNRGSFSSSSSTSASYEWPLTGGAVGCDMTTGGHERACCSSSSRRCCHGHGGNGARSRSLRNWTVAPPTASRNQSVKRIKSEARRRWSHISIL